MVKLFTWISCLTLAIIATSCCDNENAGPEIISQSVIFQYESENFAWGHFHKGWYMDSVGQLHVYNLPDDWVYPDTAGFISKEDLLSNLGKTDSIVYTVDASELNSKLSSLAEVDEWLTDPEHIAYDAGGQELRCFVWDAQRMKYKVVLLLSTGNFRRVNLDPEALELTEWLQQVGERSETFTWF